VTLQVVDIDRIEPLDEFRTAWADLLAETPGASFFQSLEWLEAWWRHFGGARRLRVLLVLDGTRPEGIVPLVLGREATRVGRLRLLGYPLDNWGSFYGPIGPTPEATLAAALAHLRRRSCDWDVIELRWLGAPGTDPAATGRALASAGMPAYRTVWDRTAVVELTGTWDEYLASRTRVLRRNLRHDRRRLDGAGRVRYERYRPAGRAAGQAGPRWDLYDACEHVAGQSWQASATDGTTLSHEAVRPFLREVHALAVEAGAADVNLLLIDDRPAAFAYNYCWGGYVYGLRTGYDPGQSPGGAGTVLLAESIRDSFARGDRLYDLGIGSLAGKRPLMTRLLPIFRYSHFSSRALRGQLVRLKRWAEERRLEEEEPAGAQ
jgi:CelD/BcsL family acetyltransferase involved in cellulose biosynthesis